jgi:hypothetical protein
VCKCWRTSAMNAMRQFPILVAAWNPNPMSCPDSSEFPRSVCRDASPSLASTAKAHTLALSRSRLRCVCRWRGTLGKQMVSRTVNVFPAYLRICVFAYFSLKHARVQAVAGPGRYWTVCYKIKSAAISLMSSNVVTIIDISAVASRSVSTRTSQ